MATLKKVIEVNSAANDSSWFKNFQTLNDYHKGLNQQLKEAQEKGDQELSAKIDEQITIVKNSITQVDNRVSEYIAKNDLRVAGIDTRLGIVEEAHKALSGEEKEGVLKIIEDALLKAIDTTKLRDIISGMSFLFGADQVSLAGFAKALYQFPEAERNEAIGFRGDGILWKEKQIFVDGREAVFTLEEAISGSNITRTYKNEDFFGEGVTALYSFSYKLIGDSPAMERNTGSQKLTYVIEIDDFTQITPEAPDLNGDGIIGDAPFNPDAVEGNDAIEVNVTSDTTDAASSSPFGS